MNRFILMTFFFLIVVTPIILSAEPDPIILNPADVPPATAGFRTIKAEDEFDDKLIAKYDGKKVKFSGFIFMTGKDTVLNKYSFYLLAEYMTEKKGEFEPEKRTSGYVVVTLAGDSKELKTAFEQAQKNIEKIDISVEGNAIIKSRKLLGGRHSGRPKVFISDAIVKEQKEPVYYPGFGPPPRKGKR